MVQRLTADDQQTSKVIRLRAAGVFHERPGSVGKLRDARKPSNIYEKRARAGYTTEKHSPTYRENRRSAATSWRASAALKHRFFLTNPA